MSLLGFNTCSCTTDKTIREGIIGWSRYFIKSKPELLLPMPDNLSGNIWFQDSVVIYEVKSLIIVANHTDTGVIRKESFETYKYTFLDIRNLICQDYYYFSDTATPICTYKLRPEEMVVWNFYSIIKSTRRNEKSSVLPDTIISNKSYKRVCIINTEVGYQTTYYLDCSSQENIFHLNPQLDLIYPGCKSVRSEFRDRDDPLTSVTEINIVSESLSSSERAVIAKWQKNAQNNKLPELTLNEVYKKYPPKSSNKKE